MGGGGGGSRRGRGEGREAAEGLSRWIWRSRREGLARNVDHLACRKSSISLASALIPRGRKRKPRKDAPLNSTLSLPLPLPLLFSLGHPSSTLTPTRTTSNG